MEKIVTEESWKEKLKKVEEFRYELKKKYDKLPVTLETLSLLKEDQKILSEMADEATKEWLKWHEQQENMN